MVIIIISKYFALLIIILILTAPSGPPLNISVDILSSSSMNVAWSPPMQELQNGIIVHYLVSIQTGDSKMTVETNVPYLTIEELHPHYTYELSVAAVTVASGPFSNTTSFTMPQDGRLKCAPNFFYFVSLCPSPILCSAPSSGPMLVEAVSQSPYNIELYWEPPSIEDQNGDIVSYYISFTHTLSGDEQTFETMADALFFSEDSFHPYYTYSVSIHAVTVAVGPGTTVNVTTMETGIILPCIE